MCDLLNWKWLVFLREVSKLIRFICHFNRWASSSCGFSPFLSPIRPFDVFFLDICRYRHLMMDVMSLLPHSKKDVKVQGKDNKAATLNELADLKSCSSCLLFEVTPFFTFWPAGSKDEDVLKGVSVVWIVLKLEMSPGFCWGRVFFSVEDSGWVCHNEMKRCILFWHLHTNVPPSLALDDQSK